MRIYMAGGSSERLTVVRPMMDHVRRDGADAIEIAHDWTQSEGYDRPFSDDEKLDAAIGDLLAVRSSALLWALVPEKPSEGMGTEIGFARGHGIPVILSGPTVGNGNVMHFLTGSVLRFAAHYEAFIFLLSFIRSGGKPERLGVEMPLLVRA